MIGCSWPGRAWATPWKALMLTVPASSFLPVLGTANPASPPLARPATPATKGRQTRSKSAGRVLLHGQVLAQPGSPPLSLLFCWSANNWASADTPPPTPVPPAHGRILAARPVTAQDWYNGFNLRIESSCPYENALLGNSARRQRRDIGRLWPEPLTQPRGGRVGPSGKLQRANFALVRPAFRDTGQIEGWACQ